MSSKPILCLDFDGVIHSYESGWKGADVIPDPPVPGAMAFILDASVHFRVVIYSSRSHQDGGIAAMSEWLKEHMLREHPGSYARQALAEIDWPTHKPSAMVTLDDRALTFSGEWPAIADLRDFRPWNKRARRNAEIEAIGKMVEVMQHLTPVERDRATRYALNMLAGRAPE